MRARGAIRIAAVSTVACLALSTMPQAHAGRRRPVGRVFLPNPVVALQDQTLRDERDADLPAFMDAYRRVRLRNLNGSGYLRGIYARIVCTSNCALNRERRFLYDRSDKRFEQVMVYFALTKAQRYLRSLGFDDVNEGKQEAVIRAGMDNSFYDPKKDLLLFGYGGVDDAEDMDLIWHEYGHAILEDQVPGFGVGADAQMIGEGFGDYWAFTMSAPASKEYHPGCIADWDSVSYSGDDPHCLRRVDLDLTVADRSTPPNPHRDGQIWSRALYDIHEVLGRRTADRIVIQGQFAFTKSTTLEAAAQEIVATAEALHGIGSVEAGTVQDAFEARGIL